MPRTIAILRSYGPLVVAGSSAGLALHFGLVGIDAMLVEKPVLLDFENRFWRSAFSFPFLPILVMEMVLGTLTVGLWVRLRRAVNEAHELDMKGEKQAATVRTLQRLMTVMAEHVARENNQILDHIASRQRRGQQTPQAVETASRRIAEILHALSEVSFVTPYLDPQDGKDLDLLAELERRIAAGSTPDGSSPRGPIAED